LTRFSCHCQVDLVGGYYDAGDNVKFGLPMAFTVTMMSWSVLEYGDQMAAAGELGHARDAVKWGTDYFIKAHPEPNVLYGEVGLVPLHPRRVASSAARRRLPPPSAPCLLCLRRTCMHACMHI
jgi:hypothetical protein